MVARALAIVSLALLVAGPGLAWMRILPPTKGFGLYLLSGLVGLAATLVAIIYLLRKGDGPPAIAWLGIVPLLCLAPTLLKVASAPRINDITTDTERAPEFVALAKEPALANFDFAFPAKFAAIVRTHYADLAPLHVELPPEAALDRARALAGRMPHWRVVGWDREAGQVEAVVETPLFHFQDYVVIRVEPEGQGSRIDMRSKSRDGLSDLGVNAARIRETLAALKTDPAS